MSTVAEDEKLYIKARKAFGSGKYANCLEEFLQLSSKGDARASFCAAAIFDRGGDGIKQDWVRARALYKVSLDQAFLPASALSLALMLYQGRGGSKDFVEAMRYYKMFPNDAFSLFMLGTMALYGYGHEKDEDKALDYYDRSWLLSYPFGLKNSAIIRFHRGQYVRSVYDFVRSSFLIFFNYGIKKLPLVKSPRNGKKVLSQKKDGGN